MAERSQKEVWKVTPWVMIALSLGNFILMAWDARETNTKQRMIRVWAQTAADFVQSPVVTNGGLVGRVTAVSPLTAQIYLLTREKVSEGGVIGEVGKSNALGVVSGTGKKELLEMGYIPGSIEVAVGESVFTTGQEGIYPAGLKIGEVVEVRAGSAAQAQQIFIRPSANLSALEEVAVLLYEPPARPDYEKTVPNGGKEKKK
jgi:rod shape-determining protein MreC